MATKKMPTADKVELAVRPLTAAERQNLVADAYLTDRVYDALLERGEASKVSEIAQEINSPNIGFALVRAALDASPRFALMDRLWNLNARYMDVTRSLERNLIDVIRAAGRPLSTAQIATELSVIYDKPSESYFSLLSKVLRNEKTYLKSQGTTYGLTEWLPLVDGEDLEDILADNKIKSEALAPLKVLSAKAGWSTTTYGDASLAIISALKGRAVPHRLLGVLGWLALGESYNAAHHINQCLADSRLVWLCAQKGNGRWITRETADKLEFLLADRATSMAEELEEAPAPVIAEPEPVVVEVVVVEPTLEVVADPEPQPIIEEVKPLQVSEDDLGAIFLVVSERSVPVEISELLALQYEVVPGDPSYKTDVAVLESRLKQDGRFLYVGAGRFREADTLPPFVYELPEFLAFPDLQFVSMDGEIMDEEIEDEGFAGTLRQEVLHPLAQDAGDDEGTYSGVVPEDLSSVRLVVKAHHKEFGTFPLCQVPNGFFPEDAPVVEVTLREEDGTTHEVIISHDIRLAFNFFSLYEKIVVDSGGVFHLHHTTRPYEYRVELTEETDPQVVLTPERYNELLSLRGQAEESGDMATFDLACELLQEHPKGLDFVQLMTETNVIRRVTRRKPTRIAPIA